MAANGGMGAAKEPIWCGWWQLRQRLGNLLLTPPVEVEEGDLRM